HRQAGHVMRRIHRPEVEGLAGFRLEVDAEEVRTAVYRTRLQVSRDIEILERAVGWHVLARDRGTAAGRRAREPVARIVAQERGAADGRPEELGNAWRTENAGDGAAQHQVVDRLV